MSSVKVRAALETAVATMPLLNVGDTDKDKSIVYENNPFTPVAGTPYQKVNILFASPDNPVYNGFYRERGYMQITLMWPLGRGSTAQGARAELIRSTFNRGRTLTKDGVNVTIEKTPEISPGFDDGDRWAVPVKIRFFANVG